MISIRIFKDKQQKTQNPPPSENDKQANAPQPVPQSVDECKTIYQNIFNNSTDIVIYSFQTAKEKAMIIYVDGMCNKGLIDRDIIAPLISENFKGDIKLTVKTTLNEVNNVASVIGEVLNGNTAIFYEDSGKAYIADFKDWDKRSVETPDNENVTRGPQEGFVENYRTNTSLLRRRIKSPNLVLENISLGRQTNTVISLAYIKGIVNQDVLEQLKEKIAKIDTDAILESGYIEQFIEKNYLSPIPTIGYTEKPDVAAARILEGRIAVICDGTPVVLTAPSLFVENLQTGEDYYQRTVIASFLRLIRFFALFICVFLPGIFVAMTTYNQEMIPSVFMATIISSAEKTPLPIGAEVFFLTTMFELLKESGTRLPRTIGSAISIVGSLIIGDAAVNAGIVGAPVVIIVALTAICSFVSPSLDEFATIYKYIILLLGGTMGFIGIGTGTMILLTQVVSTYSFGIPILSSLSKSEMKDFEVRFPLWKMRLRPISIAKDNVKRQKDQE